MGKAPGFLEIKNWEKYQHYRDRNPPWIKLYHALLDDYEYCCLQDASKLLLMSLFLLASRCENKIPIDMTWIKRKSAIKGKIDFKPLLNAGFISLNGDASNPLAPCKQNGVPEKRRDREETEKKKYLECVHLTTQQHEKLITKWGSQRTDKAIEILNNHKMAMGKTYKSDYHAILNWAMEKASQQVGSTESKPTCKSCGKGVSALVGGLCFECDDQVKNIVIRNHGNR